PINDLLNQHQFMSEEFFQSYSPEQVMVVTSPQFQSTISDTDNSIFINNPDIQDFTIYSQETSTTDFLNNGFPSFFHVGPQQAIVESVGSTFNSPLDSHIESSPILENSGYTHLDQSIQLLTSPHGNSINTPSLNLQTNNVFTPHSSPYTPLLEDNNILLNSPISYIGVPQQQRQNISAVNLFNEPIGTPVFSDLGTPQVFTTSISTPYTPYRDEPCYSGISSLNTTPYLPPQTPDTPFVDQSFIRVCSKDPVLFDSCSKLEDFFPLFITNNNSVPAYCSMASTQMDIHDIEKKLDMSSSEAAVVPGTPSSGSISTSEKSPSLAVPEHASEIDPRPSNIDSIDFNNNSGTKSPNHSSDSAHTTPANTPRLVPIRPRESGEHSEPIRRSKRQKRKNLICKLIELLMILIVSNHSLVNILIVVQDSPENMI
ncbi:16623_t:CDS:2, partial [Racocetra persica]